MVQKNKFAQLLNICFFLLLMWMATACGSSKKLNKDFVYFQTGLDSMGTIQFKEPVIQINDVLSIIVTSTSLNQDQTGNVEIPVVGSIKAAGLTKVQLEAVIKEKISSYVKDASVLIRFLQFKINVLGEVRAPGSHSFETDYVTIIDALSSAGDLTDNGKRNDIIVIREENGNRKYFKVDLRSASLFQSPVYQLQPNDIVYVGVNKNKLATLNVNYNSQRSLQTIFSITSVVTTLTYLVLTLTRK